MRSKKVLTILCSFTDDLVFLVKMLNLGQANDMAKVLDDATDGKNEGET